MWSQYCDDGRGCCLVIKDNFFDKDEEQIDKEIIKANFLDDINEDDKNNNEVEKYYNRELYCLYEVVYTDKYMWKESEYGYIKKIIDSIISVLKKINAKDKEFKSTKKIVVAILDQIRFLFKDYNYKHEQEVRVIKFAQKENVKCTPKGDFRVPHLYIDLDKELEYKEIILGPKVDKPIEIATYLDYTGKVGCIKKSKIRYQ